MSDVPYEEGFKRGSLGLAFIERYAEYSKEDISCKRAIQMVLLRQSLSLTSGMAL